MTLSRPSTIGRSDSVCGEIGRDHYCAQRGMNDGTAAGERVGGRAGRGRDHEPVAAVRIDEIPVDPNFELDHAAGFLPLHDDVVEREVRALGAVRMHEPSTQQLATISLVTARQHVVDVGEHLVGKDVGQETEPAAIDADERDTARKRELCREEQGAVAADRDDEVRLLPELGDAACG